MTLEDRVKSELEACPFELTDSLLGDVVKSVKMLYGVNPTEQQIRDVVNGLRLFQLSSLLDHVE